MFAAIIPDTALVWLANLSSCSDSDGACCLLFAGSLGPNVARHTMQCFKIVPVCSVKGYSSRYSL